MMKANFLYFFTAILMIFFQNFAIGIGLNPISETAIIKSPNVDYNNWKEISRSLMDTQGLVERIPVDQTVENWSELVAVQYLKLGNVNESFNDIMEILKKQTLTKYPGSKVSWNVIEENKNDMIYEWILHEPYKKIPLQHEIARAFLTKGTFHRVGFTRTKTPISLQEREEWIKVLKESSVMSLKEASKIKGFSLFP